MKNKRRVVAVPDAMHVGKVWFVLLKEGYGLECEHSMVAEFFGPRAAAFAKAHARMVRKIPEFFKKPLTAWR